jgi:type IV pilus assembly protein PilO
MAATQGGALADFGRRPLGFKLGVFLGVAAALGLVYYQLMLRPLQKKMKTAKARQTTLIQEQTDLKAQNEKGKAMAAARDSLEVQLNKDREALPTEAELPAFFDTINRKVGDAGVQVKRWEYRKEVAVDDFYRVPVEVELSGTFPQLKHFFASLLPREEGGVGADGSQKDRIITIDGLTLSDPTVKDGELILTAKFTASTFRQEEPKQAAALPGSASLPLPAGTGAPSGGLPGQVKSEVEQDMKLERERGAAAAHPDGSGSGSASGSAKLKGGM